VNIALVKLSSLGDVVHALPAAAALRRGLPHARIIWLAERREAALLRGSPAVDVVVPVDTRGWRRARSPWAAARAVGAVVEIRRFLREARIDVAVDLQGNIKSGLLTCATGAALRIGFSAAYCQEIANVAFTNYRVTPGPDAVHVVQQCVALLAPLGVRAGTVEFPLSAFTEAEQRIGGFFSEAGLKPRQRLLVVSPGAGQAGKRWPVERFQRVAAALVDEAGVTILVVWGPGEEKAAESIAAGLAGVIVAPATGIPELVAVLRRASVVVAGDTGPLHLAAALGRPCVGLYGPTSVDRNGPWGQIPRCVVAGDYRMESLAVAQVQRSILDALDGGGLGE